MDPGSIVEDTERTWFCPWTDGPEKDGQKDKLKPVYPSFNFFEDEGIKIQYKSIQLTNFLIL